MWYFRAIAFDLDGTLAVWDTVAPGVLAAIDAARPERRLVLVTGRTRADLDRVFPALADHFDGVITENGAVLQAGAAASLPLNSAIDLAVDKALAERGIAADRGRVVIAVDGRDTAAANEVIASLGLDCQVVHNRGAAMILPAGVTKGTGLRAALAELGLSPHNCIAVGDAENDLALLRAAEVGIAVSNAVPSLREHADLVLDAPDGDAIIGLLADGLLSGRDRMCPQRHHVSIGQHEEDGAPALVPGSQASMLIRGGSGTGKSYLAGLLAERWIEAGYSVLIIDPEGDHLGLADRPGVLVVDVAAHLPSPSELLATARPSHASLVLDLSGLSLDDRLAYLNRLPPAIAAERRRYGIPQWVIFDEAHEPAWLDINATVAISLADIGSCLVTWRPEALPAEITRTVDLTLTVSGADTSTGRAESWRAVLTTADAPERTIRLAERISPHVRHRHKYTAMPLPSERRFYFHPVNDAEPTAVAATVGEFAGHLRHCDLSTVGYHLGRGDFSRWVKHTLADHVLGQELATIEHNLAAAQAATLEQARQDVLEVINRRYPG